MQLHTDNRPIIRFSMFQAWWQNKQTAMQRYFPEEPTSDYGTKWMDAGTRIAEGLEERPLPWWLSDITPADISEHRIIEEFDGALVRGTLDKFMTTTNTVIDNKSLKRKMTPKEQKKLDSQLLYTPDDFAGLKNKFDEKDAIKYRQQLLFYQVLVEQKYGSVDPMSYIEVIPVMEDCNGLIRRTGEPAYSVPVPITQAERDEMREKIISTAKDIVLCWDAYLRGDIKLQSMKQNWQGYKHSNGSYQAKPAWIFDAADARMSPLVEKVSDVVEADGREEALKLIEENIESK